MRFDLGSLAAGGAPAPGAGPEPGPDSGLPELRALPWRRRTDAEALRRWARTWTAWMAIVSAPFVGAGVGLLVLEPLAFPAALASFAHAWVIPELYAARGTNVTRPKGSRAAGAEPVAQGLLADLLDHRPRELQRQTGLAIERGALGVWLVAEAGALLAVRGGRRVHCFCVRTKDRTLPPSDRVAHLLLALRTDEAGFATVANHAFAGAAWRVRRRLPARQRPALDAALAAARVRG